MKRLGSFILLLAMLVGIFLLTQSLGRYLIQEITLEEEQLTEQMSQKKKIILHLPTEKYYVLQVGIFADENMRNQLVNVLKEEGYSIVINHQAPYKVWIGCVGEKKSGDLQNDLLTKYPDCTINEMVLNQVSFSYWADDIWKSSKMMNFVCNADVLLKHSLKTFRSFDMEAYDKLLLNEMLVELQKECTVLLSEISAIQLEREEYTEQIYSFQSALESYQKSLAQLENFLTTDKLLEAQNKLCYLIHQYHDFIINNSD